jgi:hypothetical protein
VSDEQRPEINPVAFPEERIRLNPFWEDVMSSPILREIVSRASWLSQEETSGDAPEWFEALGEALTEGERQTFAGFMTVEDILGALRRGEVTMVATVTLQEELPQE